MTAHSTATSSAPKPDAEVPDNRRRQEEAARMEQRLSDPAWRPLAQYVRKKLGDQFTLSLADVYYLVHGRKDPWPMTGGLQFTVAEFLAMMSRCSPKTARRLLDALLDSQREKRARPTAERNARWKRWHDDGMGPTAIAKRWRQETGEVVEPNAVKQALQRTGR
jgi:hypothetical protein